jgi:hypothetical protein
MAIKLQGQTDIERMTALRDEIHRLKERIAAKDKWLRKFREALPIHVFGTEASGGVPDATKYDNKLTITAGEIRELDAALRD